MIMKKEISMTSDVFDDSKKRFQNAVNDLGRVNYLVELYGWSSNYVNQYVDAMNNSSVFGSRVGGHKSPRNRTDNSLDIKKEKALDRLYAKERARGGLFGQYCSILNPWQSTNSSAYSLWMHVMRLWQKCYMLENKIDKTTWDNDIAPVLLDLKNDCNVLYGLAMETINDYEQRKVSANEYRPTRWDDALIYIRGFWDKMVRGIRAFFYDDKRKIDQIERMVGHLLHEVDGFVSNLESKNFIDKNVSERRNNMKNWPFFDPQKDVPKINGKSLLDLVDKN